MARWVPIDPRDIAQERELARLEGRDPKQAVRAFVRQEHRFYDWIAGGMDPGWDWVCPAPEPLPVRPHRTPESIERRRAYTREWWRRNGAEYRAKRKHMSGSAGGT